MIHSPMPVSLANSYTRESILSHINGQKNVNMSFRSVRKIIPQQTSHWVGDGFNVFPVFGSEAFTHEVSPWLMFDYAAPKHFSPTTKQRGVGQHPHRGFETVTIAFKGEVEHADSVGNRDVIGPQDVQWMTAGRGVIHEEFQSTGFAKKGGTFEMCQLWLNLPKKHKMTPPKYQPILDKTIPVVQLADGVGKVRVIAGEFGDVSGPAQTFTPVEVWDVSIEKEEVPIEFDVPKGHNVIVFVRRGGVKVGKDFVGPQAVALTHREGGKLSMSATEANTQVLLMGGEPIDEPIAARGPFVMNTPQELLQANSDYQSGRFGQ